MYILLDFSGIFEFLLFQEEECEENYVKKCFIQYGKTAQNVTVNICRTPLVKDCDIEGDEVTGFSILRLDDFDLQVCSTQYESECLTEQEIHEVCMFSPHEF